MRKGRRLELTALKPADIARLLPWMTFEERAELDAILAADPLIWRPIPGPQTDAFYCEADITGYGGAAGGGKSDLLSGLVTTAHLRSVIFRREKAQTLRITQRITELLNTTNGLNSQAGIWKLPDGRLLELGGLDNPGDERRWQGRDHDLKAYDEVTEMREGQVRYTMGWNRSPDPAVRSRVVMTFNPPTTAEGQWVIKFFAPWLDPLHPNPAKPGELRWFTTIGDDQDVEVEGPEPFVLIDGERVYDFDARHYSPEDVIRPKSRTFIPSRVTDNPFYVASGYISTLQSLPEPLRSQMLKGDFMAGVQDDAFQVIPTAWVEAAMLRWTARDAKGDMDSVGADVARGGKDKFVIARRHGLWFDVPVVKPGVETPDGPTGAAFILVHRRDLAPIHVDIIGWGSSVFDFLNENHVQVVGVNNSEGSFERTKEGDLPFVNVRAQDLWAMREALDPKNPNPIYLPPDPTLKADLCAPRWRWTTRGIQVEEKAEVAKRIGRSPDYGDAYVMALRATMKTAGRRKTYEPEFIEDRPTW